MVLTWLKGEECVPTWKALCDALRAPAVGEIGIAEQIEREQLQYSGEEQNDGGLPSQTTNGVWEFVCESLCTDIRDVRVVILGNDEPQNMIHL